MNKHLNVYKFYTKNEREYQLENDLTRALAITFQEDVLFFHEFLKEVFNASKEKNFDDFFNSYDNEAIINIDIQKNTKEIPDFEYIFAIGLSESELGDFNEQENFSISENGHICDLVINIKNICVLIEVKRDNVDCTEQLQKQIFNILSKKADKIPSKNIISVKSLNWLKLMEIAGRVSNFEKILGEKNRFLSDFISLVRNHNYRWLPEKPIKYLSAFNKDLILRRIESGIDEANKKDEKIVKLPYSDRLGIKFFKDWAQEILFNVNEEGDLLIVIYPGNTKQQGYSLFENNPDFNNKIKILEKNFDLEHNYHLKFTSFQKFFTGLWFTKEDLKENFPLYTKENFKAFAGRKKRIEWEKIEALLNKSFTLKYEWKKRCGWDEKIKKSGKTQFDLSFGYEVFLKIPFKDLQEIDNRYDNLDKLTDMIIEIFNEFENNLLKN